MEFGGASLFRQKTLKGKNFLRRGGSASGVLRGGKSFQYGKGRGDLGKELKHLSGKKFAETDSFWRDVPLLLGVPKEKSPERSLRKGASTLKTRRLRKKIPERPSGKRRSKGPFYKKGGMEGDTGGLSQGGRSRLSKTN